MKKLLVSALALLVLVGCGAQGSKSSNQLKFILAMDHRELEKPLKALLDLNHSQAIVLKQLQMEIWRNK
ncbi:hypothetical protein MGH68_09445 [Erysipelothrix sp. D19-032]